MSGAPWLVLEEVRFFERDVRLRMPFRFGIVTLREAPQVFVRVRIRLSGGRTAHGQSAEMLAPKWFDKNPDLTNEQNFDQLRTSLAIAARLMREKDAPSTAFGLHAAVSDDHYAACAQKCLNGLVAGFGTALLDRAVLDALCRAEGVPVFDTVRRNLPGMEASTAPDLMGFDLPGFMASLRPAATIESRHTVGLADAITDDEITPEIRVGDGLPESLEAVVRTYGHRYFKLKVGGDLEADIERLTRIAGVIDRLSEPYFVSLDGNEQYADTVVVIALLERMARERALARLYGSILYVEQPITRGRALDSPIHDLGRLKPVAVDESDTDIGVFPRAIVLGYTGISSKSCKGFYRSLLNRARVAKWNGPAGGPYFMTAEDLTTQAGVALQQDLALATLIGCTHVERNGHHYVDGMAGAPWAEQQRFLTAHPDLYREQGGRARVAIRGGRLAIGSLGVPGLGVGPEPDWGAMTPKHYEG